MTAPGAKSTSRASSATSITKVPTTRAELEQAAQLPFNDGNALISRADKKLVQAWGSSIYPNFGFGYLHSSDHYYALKVINPDREPSYREVYDSYHSGSANIDKARVKAGAGLRPSGWDDWDDATKRYAILVHIHGAAQGSRIFDGKRKDPTPDQTKALMTLWGLAEKPEPDKPVDPVKPDKPIDPTKPTDPDKPPVSADDVLIEVHVMVNGVKRMYRCTEIK